MRKDNFEKKIIERWDAKGYLTEVLYPQGTKAGAYIFTGAKKMSVSRFNKEAEPYALQLAKQGHKAIRFFR